MSERLIRLLRMIMLIQSQPGITAKEIAEKCETTQRTIYRDINHLSAAHIPITNDGYGKGYKFIGNFAMYPLNWTNEEAVAFSLLPSLLKSDSIPIEFYSAYEKVLAAQIKEQKKQLDDLEKMVSIIQTGTSAASSYSNNDYFLTVVQAILNSRSLEVIYHTKSRDVITSRLIDPYFLIPRENRFYLIAYCHRKEKFLTFRMSRFHKMVQTDQKFDKKKFNIKEFFKNTWSIISGDEKIHFKVLFNKNVARYVKEQELFVTPVLTENENGSLLFEVTLNHDQEFLQWVMQYGNDAEIIEPNEYRKKMKEMLSEWIKKY